MQINCMKNGTAVVLNGEPLGMSGFQEVRTPAAVLLVDTRCDGVLPFLLLDLELNCA